MKNLFLTFLCFGLVLTSCTDETIIVEEVDPIIGQTFDVELFNFVDNDGNNEAIETFTIDNVFPGDVPLVFRFNTDINVFEPLPTSFFFDNDGFVSYRFDFAFFDGNELDVNLILETDNFNALDPIFTNNQDFRIVVLPSDIVNEIQEENLTLEQVEQKFNLELDILKN